MKIAIAGTGYVGLANAILLAQHNEVVAIDIVPEKVELLNRKQSSIEDVEIEDYMTTQAPTSTNTDWQHATATRPRSDAQSVLNKSSLTPFLHKPDETMRKLMDVSKLNQMGWKARTALRDGIEIAYERMEK